MQPFREATINQPVVNKLYSPAQKWEEVTKLRKMAWDLKWALVKQSHPDLSDEEIRKKVRAIFLYATT